MTQIRYWNFKDDDITIGLDEWFHGIVLPGVYQGFDFGTQDSMILHLVHSTTGSKYVKKEPPSESNFIGVIKTRQGVIVQEDGGIDIPIQPADGSLPRIDLVFLSHEYIDTQGGQPAYYGVIEGTPNANPVAPSLANALTDIAIGTLYVPAGIADLTDIGVIYIRSEVPTLANENYAHRNKVNRYTEQAQNAPENSAISFNTGTNLLTINTHSNAFALPTNITTSIPLSSITVLPSGTEIKLRVMTSAGITVTHNPTPSSGQIFCLQDEQTLFYPKGTVLYMVAQDDGSWMMVDYSLKPVWNRTNAFLKAQQSPYGTGVKIKSVTYVVSSVSYTSWILEIDPTAQNHILDLSNGPQMNSFNLTTDVLELGVIDTIAGFKTINSGLANGAFINIKVIGAVGTLNSNFAAHPLPVQTGTYLYLDNRGELNNITNSGSLVALPLAQVTNTGNGCSEFTIKINGGNKYALFSPLAIYGTIGSSAYNNNTFYADGSSHKVALDAIVNAVTDPGTLNAFSYASGKYVDYSSSPARYSKSINGTVRFKGAIETTSSGGSTLMATLPFGFRPLKLQQFPVLMSSSGLGEYVLALLVIQTNGTCSLQATDGSAVGDNDIAWLNTIHFNIND